MKSDLDLKTYERTVYERIYLFIQHFHAVSDKLVDEEDVKSSIIDEFLKILGWNLQDHLEVKKEQKVEGRIRADYALKVDGKVKIYIEAKSLDKDIEKGLDETPGAGKRTYIEQTINYAYNSGVNWALLTNGKRWILFNAYWKGTHKDRIAFDLEIDDFLKDNNFDKIKLLAKEYVVTGRLDEYFKERPFRRPIDEEVVSFLLECRRALTESVIKNNEGKYTTDQLREGIHRILDRLVFYKICEDRDILDYGRVKKTFDIFREDKSSQSFVSGLKSYYDWFNRIYDGELFGPHFCEDFIVDNDVYKLIVDGLYQYDFATIDADILGRIYENYLGNTLQELEKGLRWVADNQERKKFGQYYTPQYVVDYIIDNVGITADSKILDPACGSGAFLIKAYDKVKLLNQEHIKRIIQKKKHNLSEDGFKKWEKEELPKIEEESVKKILTENIHGVDLNPESVELTKVNLWLRSIQKDTPLNKLENNIACGNSLISGTEDELRQYFGDDWKEKRPFNWEKEFKDVFAQGGFDVVIGNPPYFTETRGYKDQFRMYAQSPSMGKYYEAKMDIFYFFIELGLDLLKEGGRLGFIVMQYWNSRGSGKILREKIVKDAVIEKVINFNEFGVFKDALGQHNSILILRKQTTPEIKEGYDVEVIDVFDEDVSKEELRKALFEGKFSDRIVKKVVKVTFDRENKKINFLVKDVGDIVIKIGQKSNYRIPRDSISQGVVLPQDKVTERQLEVLPKSQFKDGQGIFLLSDSELKFISLNQYEKQLIQPFYWARQIDTYYYEDKNIEWLIYGEKRYIGYDDVDINRKAKETGKDKEDVLKGIINEIRQKYPTITKHLDKFQAVITSDRSPYGLHRSRRKEIFLNPNKIVSIRKTKYPKFIWIPEPCFMDQSVNYIVPEEGIDPKYLTALLNSKLMWFWFKYGAQKTHGKQLQIDKEVIEKAPLINLSKDQQKQFIALVDKMLSLNRELQTININFFEYVNLHPKVKDTDLGFYFNQLSMNDKRVLNNANGIVGNIKNVKVREEGDWLFVSVDYANENDELIENFDVLKCRFENPNFTKFIKHCILNYGKSIGKGNLLERILKINNIPIFDNRDKTKNQQIIDEIMDSFLPALERKEGIEKEIEETDKDIDKMVYELYGLTEGEIKIIEEASA